MKEKIKISDLLNLVVSWIIKKTKKKGILQAIGGIYKSLFIFIVKIVKNNFTKIKKQLKNK